jgi:outer membrane lipoprotein SlyB
MVPLGTHKEVVMFNRTHIGRALAGFAFVAMLGACASEPRYVETPQVVGTAAPYSTSCYDCGTVESIDVVQTTGSSTGTGAVLGGIVGGVVGNQVGSGEGKKVATVAGVVGGAVAGNAIEKNMHKEDYQVTVRMDDGRRLTVTQGDVSSSLHVGSRVRLVDGRFQLY